MSSETSEDGPECGFEEFLGLDQPLEATPHDALKRAHFSVKEETRRRFQAAIEGERNDDGERVAKLLDAEECIRHEFVRRQKQRRYIDKNGAAIWDTTPPADLMPDRPIFPDKCVVDLPTRGQIDAWFANADDSEDAE